MPTSLVCDNTITKDEGRENVNAVL